MSFGLYAAGYAIVIIGLVYAAHLMHIPPHWIFVGAIVMVGIGLLSAVKATRPKDPSQVRIAATGSVQIPLPRAVPSLHDR